MSTAYMRSTEHTKRIERSNHLKSRIRCAALLYAWPGPIYEGNGECQAVIDEQADDKQRNALATVLCGGETNEGATHWCVYRRCRAPSILRSSNASSVTCHFTLLRQSGKGVIRSR